MQREKDVSVVGRSGSLERKIMSKFGILEVDSDIGSGDDSLGLDRVPAVKSSSTKKNCLEKQEKLKAEVGCRIVII
jgi:hypothetical protein